jgi:hypothetical protein
MQGQQQQAAWNDSKAAMKAEQEQAAATRATVQPAATLALVETAAPAAA